MVIKAKYQGVCKKCGSEIRVGEEIEWSRETGARHVTCPEKETSEEMSEEMSEKSYKLYGGSGYGCNGWSKGQVIKSNEQQRQKGYPEFLMVVRSKHQYYREEGMSFGVGDESGYVYSASCRAATDEESAPLRAKIAAREVARQRAKRLSEIKTIIQTDGERPDGEHSPDGERLHDTQNIYGGGDWFVLDGDEIWYVRNNGHDGDNWELNNVRTGGAGAIGWRIVNSELAAEIRNLI
jgi:hypothetical protein